MTSCVFRYCKNTTRNVSESSGISFHRFVHPGHDKREEWIRILQEDRKEDTWLPSKYSNVCSAHFNTDDYYITKCGKRFLKKSAVPLENASISLEIQPASPSSLDHEQISDCESIFDSPRKIKLKKELSKVSAAKKLLAKKVKKLQQQNNRLRQKNETLIAVVKQLKISQKKLIFTKYRNTTLQGASGSLKKCP